MDDQTLETEESVGQRRELALVMLGMMGGMSGAGGMMYLIHISGGIELSALAPWLFVAPLVLMFAVPTTLQKAWEWGERLEERLGVSDA